MLQNDIFFQRIVQVETQNDSVKQADIFPSLPLLITVYSIFYLSPYCFSSDVISQNRNRNVFSSILGKGNSVVIASKS